MRLGSTTYEDWWQFPIIPLSGIIRVLLSDSAPAAASASRLDSVRTYVPKVYRPNPKLLGLHLLLLPAFLAGTGCSQPVETSLADSERAAITDSIVRLQRSVSTAIDTKDCEVAVARLGDTFGIVIDGRPNRAFDLAACERLNANRISSVNEVQDEQVYVLGSDAAYLVISSTYTVTRTDGTVTATPMLTTAIWSRINGAWRLQHIHESWRDTEIVTTTSANRR